MRQRTAFSSKSRSKEGAPDDGGDENNRQAAATNRGEKIMSALFFLGLALRRFRLAGAAKLGLLLVAAQATLFESMILRPAGDVAQAKAAVSASAAEQPQSPAATQCREETIMLDDGYGLRGEETRVICGR